MVLSTEKYSYIPDGDWTDTSYLRVDKCRRRLDTAKQ